MFYYVTFGAQNAATRLHLTKENETISHAFWLLNNGSLLDSGLILRLDRVRLPYHLGQ